MSEYDPCQVFLDHMIQAQEDLQVAEAELTANGWGDHRHRTANRARREFNRAQRKYRNCLGLIERSGRVEDRGDTRVEVVEAGGQSGAETAENITGDALDAASQIFGAYFSATNPLPPGSASTTPTTPTPTTESDMTIPLAIVAGAGVIGGVVILMGGKKK